MALSVVPFRKYTAATAVADYVNQELQMKAEDDFEVNCVHNSLFIFGFDSRFRRFCCRIINNVWFRGAVLFVIIFNSICLALDDPAFERYHWLKSILDILDHVFVCFFTIEMLLKVVVFGLAFHTKSYLRDAWNVIDAVVVVAGLLGYIVDGTNGFSALRVVRVLRPLRTVSRVRALKRILTKLVLSLPRLADVFVLLFFVTWVFAVVGVQLFMGVLHQRCYALSPVLPFTTTLIQNDTLTCSEGKWGHLCNVGGNGYAGEQACEVHEEIFFTRILNFDNLLTALLYTFKLVCRDDWTNDLIAIGHGVSTYTFFYFFAVTFLCGYFCVTLFVAVLCNTFSRKSNEEEDDDEEEEHDRVAPATPEVTTFAAVLGTSVLCNAMRVAYLMKTQQVDLSGIKKDPSADVTPEVSAVAVAPTQAKPVRFWKKVANFFDRKGWKRVEKIVNSRPYFYVAMLFVFANAVILSLDRYNAGYTLSQVVSKSTFAFNIIFLVDVATRMVGLGPSFFSNLPNICDLGLCLLSIPDLIQGSSSAWSALRAFRLIRLLRLARKWKALQRLLNLVILSVKSVASLSLVSLIVIYMYSILGFHLFQRDYPTMRISFANIFDSALAVFVMITGENWACIMKEVMVTSSVWAFPYFLSLVIFGNFMLTNLFIAVILDHLSDASNTVPKDEELLTETTEVHPNHEPIADEAEPGSQQQLDDRVEMLSRHQSTLFAPSRVRASTSANDVVVFTTTGSRGLRRAEILPCSMNEESDSDTPDQDIETANVALERAEALSHAIVRRMFQDGEPHEEECELVRHYILSRRNERDVVAVGTNANELISNAEKSLLQIESDRRAEAGKQKPKGPVALGTTVWQSALHAVDPD